MKTLLTALVFSLLSFSPQALAAELQVSSQSINNGTLPSNAVRVPFLNINLQSTNGSTEIKSLIIQRQGLSSSEDIGRVWAQTSTYRQTNKRQFTNDDQVELSFRTPLVIAEKQPVRVTVYANLNSLSGGRTVRFNLLDINHNAQSLAEPDVQLVPQTPAITRQKTPYDRTRFRIKCVNSRCQLVPRT